MEEPIVASKIGDKAKAVLASTMDLRSLQKILQTKTMATSSRGLKLLFAWLEKVISDYANFQAIGLWSAAIITGLLAVGYAALFRGIESAFESFLHHTPWWSPLFLTPLCFLIGWWIVDKAAPEAAGSGIPQVMTAIEVDPKVTDPKFTDRLLSWKTGIVKILSSLFCLAGGGAIGREGPTIQLSAIIFHNIGKIVRRLYPNSHERVWVIAGASAGLASAFNTPLGGIVYAIEELGVKHFYQVRTALLSAVIISGLVAQTVLGSYLYLGHPVIHPAALASWPLILLTGFVGGIAGTAFSETLIRAMRRRRQIQKKWALAAFTVICGGLAALLIIDTPEAAGGGMPLITRILFTDEIPSFFLVVERFLGTTLAYLSGAAGGIFSPSLAIGAALGAKIAAVFGNPQINLFAMLGMIAFLTAVTHAPFTAFILVMEMSDRHSAIFPMMLVALIANSTAKTLRSKSFYEEMRDGWLSSAPPREIPMTPTT